MGMINKYKKDHLEEKLFNFVMEFISLTCYREVEKVYISILAY
jgi:hypothetical protein